MKIYTRRGDEGETGLIGGARRPKDDARIAAYGDVDELNATLGLAALTVASDSTRQRIESVQRDLFAIGAHLATEPGPDGSLHPSLPDLPSGRPEDMERWIDEADEAAGRLRAFILPGGTLPGAHLHVSRTVCRRAERSVVALARESVVDGSILVYLNRLSDYLFAASRLENHIAGVGDLPWKT